MDNTVEIKYFSKNIGIHWILFLAGLLLSNVLLANAEQSITATESEQSTIKCNHGSSDSSAIQTIFWELRSDGAILAQLFEGELKKVHQKFKDRVSISYPEGDLTISDIVRSDTDYFRCVTIQDGIRSESNDGWIKLNVNVKPENFRIMCSGNTFSTPGEDCKHIKREAIKAIQCQVYSSPISYIVWSKVPPGCSIKTSGSTAEGELLQKRTSLLRNLCDGEYCCLAEYNKDITNTLTTCVTVGNPLDPYTDQHAEKPDKEEIPGISQIEIPGISQTDRKIWIAVGAIAAFVLIVAIFIVCKYIDRSRLREDFPVLCRCCPEVKVHDYEPDKSNATWFANSPNKEDEFPDIVADIIDKDHDIDPARYSQNEPPITTSARKASSPRNVLKRQETIDENDGMEEIVKSASTPSGAPKYTDSDDVDGPVDPFIEFGKKDDQKNEVLDNNNTVGGGDNGLFSQPHDAFLDSNPQITNESSPLIQEPVKVLKISIYKKRDPLKHNKIRKAEACAYPT